MLARDFWVNVQETDFEFAFCTFLDEFYASPNKEELIKDPPPYTVQNKKDEAFFAASVHKLACLYNITPPEWVFEKKYTLARPYYQLNTTWPDYQAYLRTKTFPEFSQRNLFFDDNVLGRV